MKVAVFNSAKILSGDITDIMGVGTAITDGVPRFVGRGRNTLETTRRAKVAHSRIAQLFTGGA
jgi:enamidase